jgi:hypothetical protein
MWKA